MSNAVATQEDPKSFPGMLKAFLPEISRALPSHLNGDRMARVALTAFRRNPTLGQCDPRSVFAAVIQSSQLGLELDTLGRAYLVPYKKNTKEGNSWKTTWECQFIPGWKGLVELVNRTGKATVWTGAVFAGDQFEYQLGDNPKCIHVPGEMYGEDEPTHVYACGRVNGSEVVVTEVWSMSKVKRHLAKYNKVGDKHYAFENMEMYGRKVALLQVLKYMPMSPEVSTAVELDHAASKGSQGLTINDAINGEWAPVPDEEPVDGLPLCTQENFDKKKAGWKKTVESGTAANDLISMIETKELLTDDQKVEIASWTPTEKK